jgi:hypothetical protein
VRYALTSCRLVRAGVRGVSFFGLLSVAGFACSCRARKKVGKERGAFYLDNPLRMPGPAGHLRQRWFTGAPAHSTTRPCAGSPADGNISSPHWGLAVGCWLFSRASRYTGPPPLAQVARRARIQTSCTNLRAFFFAYFLFGPPKRKQVARRGETRQMQANPATASKQRKPKNHTENATQ